MRHRTAVTAAFYTALAVVIVGVLAQLLPHVLPDALADRIGRNSEGIALALLLAAWIQFARPRPAVSSRTWSITAAAAVACLVLGVLLLASDLPSRFRTLNETFLAAALLIPYVQLRRPLPRYLAAGAAAVVLLTVVVFNRTPAVTDLAETLGMLLLAPLAFDVVDRGILDPRARTSSSLRWAWYGLLVAVPVGFTVLEYAIGVDGLVGEAVRYGVRITEAFVFLLLVQLYFAVALGRTGRGVTADPARAVQPVS
jgi:hypothetical protein